MTIKHLSQFTINKIAAGEVIERPSAVVKELVENSIDAGASAIEIIVNNAGKNLITVIDNGDGMNKEDLGIAIQRHTTSKLEESDISDIKYLGFRGEALASIAAVSRMTITSKKSLTDNIDDHAWSINLEGNEYIDLIPANFTKGTKITVRDLFFTTPARLKFLKSDKIELQHITDIVKKIAMSNYQVTFILKNEHKTLINTNLAENTEDKFYDRIKYLLGEDFIKNSIYVDSEINNKKIKGYASLPTLNKSNANEFYLFLNNRPIRDKILITAIKIAYQDFLASDRYPIVAIFLDIPNDEVDVNVHPTKAEVRFKDNTDIRKFVISSIKNGLAEAKHRASSTIAKDTLAYFKTNKGDIHNNQDQQKTTNYSSPPKQYNFNNKAKEFHKITETINHFQKPNLQPNSDYIDTKISNNSYITQNDNNNNINKPHAKIDNDVIVEVENKDNIVTTTNHESYFLGAAKCQLHETYIISQTNDSIVITDQHASHERLVYEELKQQYFNNRVKTQRLLIPEIIELQDHIIEKFMQKQQDFASLGLIFEKFANSSLKINEIPSVIENYNTTKLISDLADDLEEYEENISFNELLDNILGTFACYHSIRKGRLMNITEMNELLRKMEQTPYSGQCNHGRPTYIELKLNDIEKLFGRK